MCSLREFPLVLRILRAHPEDLHAERLELSKAIAEGAGLRGAATGAGDVVPAGDRRLVRSPRARIEEAHRPLFARPFCEVHNSSRRRWKRHSWHLDLRQVGTSTLVPWGGQAPRGLVQAAPPHFRLLGLLRPSG